MKEYEVYLAADPVNAEIVKDMLIDRGITAHVRNQYLWGAMGNLPANIYPQVWIENPDLYQRARELVAEFENGPATTARSWRCPGCAERVEGQFSACWYCQHPRPE